MRVYPKPVNKINEIKSVKDALDCQVKNIEMQLKKRDTLLISSINQSKSIIKEIERKVKLSEKTCSDYERNSQLIINELVELSKKQKP